MVLGKIWYFGNMEQGIRLNYTVFRNVDAISVKKHGILEGYIVVYVLSELGI